MSKAIGLIESKGMLAAIVVADEMVKTSNVEIVNQKISTGALVTTIITGDLSSVQAAIDAGKDSVQQSGELHAYRVIPHPDEQTSKLYIKEILKPPKVKSPPKKKTESTVKKEVDKK